MDEAEKKWNGLPVVERRHWWDALIIMDRDKGVDILPSTKQLNGKFQALPKVAKAVLAANVNIIKEAQEKIKSKKFSPHVYDVVHGEFWFKN